MDFEHHSAFSSYCHLLDSVSSIRVFFTTLLIVHNILFIISFVVHIGINVIGVFWQVFLHWWCWVFNFLSVTVTAHISCSVFAAGRWDMETCISIMCDSVADWIMLWNLVDAWNVIALPLGHVSKQSTKVIYPGSTYTCTFGVFFTSVPIPLQMIYASLWIKANKKTNKSGTFYIVTTQVHAKHTRFFCFPQIKSKII